MFLITQHIVPGPPPPPQSIIFNGTSQYGRATMPNLSPFSALGDFRIEGRVHDWAGDGVIWKNRYFALSLSETNSRVEFLLLTDTANTVMATMAVPSNYTDFVFRARSLVGPGGISCEIWSTDGSNHSGENNTSGGPATTLNWSLPTGFKFSIGAEVNSSFVASSFLDASVAWVRFYSSAGSYNATAPTDEDTLGDLLSYEFDGNESDSSANARHLSLIGTPSFTTTP